MEQGIKSLYKWDDDLGLVEVVIDYTWSCASIYVDGELVDPGQHDTFVPIYDES